MNCFCNLFNDPTVWLIIIALILLFMNCGSTTCGNDTTRGCSCGSSNFNSCGC